MKLKRTVRLTRGPLPRTALELLRLLGLNFTCKTRSAANRDGFWLREEHRLHDILWDARKLWLKLMKKYHPDKGGNNRIAERLNVIWSRLKSIFARKGITLNA